MSSIVKSFPFLEHLRYNTLCQSPAYQKMLELADGRENYSGKCFISSSDCMDDAKALSDLVEAGFPKLNGKVQHFSIGTTIGSHTGPGTVALFFWGDKRTD